MSGAKTFVFVKPVGEANTTGDPLPAEAIPAAKLTVCEQLLRRLQTETNGTELPASPPRYRFSFAGVADAVRFATSVQKQWAVDRLSSQEGEAPPRLAVALRIGIHCARETNDALLEREVRLPRRLMGFAQGGQIIVSETVAQRIDADLSELEEPVTVQPLGARAVRGFGTIDLFELTYDAVHRTASVAPSSPNNLPLPPEGFVGREPVRIQLHQDIYKGEVIILKGTGGIGKTSLAVKFLEEAYIEGELPGGVAVIDCEFQPSLSECVRSTAQVLLGTRMEQEALSVCRERVQEYLKQKRTGVFLDNFETVAEDGAILRWLREDISPSFFIITTRWMPMELSGNVYEIGSLEPCEAMALFQRRAVVAGWRQSESSASAPSKDQQSDVSKLCELVGELPLAIELLAARAGRIPLPRLVDILDQDITVLGSQGDSTRPERHQSIEISLNFSYEVLTDAARELLKSVCVLRDGAGLDTITKILDKKEESEWKEEADELLRASMWQHDLRLGYPRFISHTLVRRFACDRMEKEERGRHTEKAIQAMSVLAQEKGEIAAPGAASPSETKGALDWLEVEWQNVIYCATKAVEQQNYEVVTRYSQGLRDYFKMRGRREACAGFYQSALDMAEKDANLPDQIRYARYLGTIYRLLGQWDTAAEMFKTCLQLSQQTEDLRNEGIAYNNLGCVYIVQGKLREAEACFVRNLKISEINANKYEQGITLSNLGEVYEAQERWQEAQDKYLLSLDISREVKDRVGEMMALNNLGKVSRHEDKLEEALMYYKQSAQIQEELGAHASDALPYTNIGDIYAQQQAWELAEESYQKSLAQRERVDDPVGKAITLKKLAELMAMQDHLDQAREYGEQSKNILAPTDDVCTKQEVHELLEAWKSKTSTPS